MNEVPRRNDLARMTGAELDICHAKLHVEEMGADPLLTEAVVLLGQAQEKVADYIDKRNEANYENRVRNAALDELARGKP